MNAFAASFVATLRAVLADRYAVVTMIGAVLLYSVYYPAAYRHQVASGFPVVVVDEDRGSVSRHLVRAIDAVRAVHVVGTAESMQAASALVERGEADAVVLLPAGLEREVWRGATGHVALVANAAFLGRASAVAQGVGEATAAVARDLARQRGAAPAPGLRVVSHPLFNTREGYGSSVVPAVAQLIVQQTLLIGVLVLAGTRRELSGGLRRLAFSRAGLAGIAAAFALIGAGSALYFNGFVFWVQDYPRGGNAAGLLLALALYVAAVVAFALFAASFFRIREHAFQAATLTSLPMYFLAGVSWPVQELPAPLWLLSRFIPTTPGIGAVLAMHPMGASVREAAFDLLNLGALAILYGALAAWRYRPAARPEKAVP